MATKQSGAPTPTGATTGEGSPAPGKMNGAESLVRTLVACGVDTSFTNPGTSEMHFVGALDRVDGMRCVLVLFEGVATGAADGYARMTDRPASTLLHLGPGLGNGLSSLHNAHRALSPVVNIVGEHATYHRRYDPPLRADIEGIARPYSQWIKTCESADGTAEDAATAVAAALAPPGQISTLILPADAAWNESKGGVGKPKPVARRTKVDEGRVRAAADMLRKGEAALVLNGPMLRTGPLEICGRIAAATESELLSPTQIPRVERGAGRVAVDRIPYVIETALKRLNHLKRLVLVNSQMPTAFFAYPGKRSLLIPEHCETMVLADQAEDGMDAVQRLADMLGATKAKARYEPLARPALPTGATSLTGIASVVAALLPENAIVVDESITSGRGLVSATRNAPPHDWMVNPGGSIGMAMPVAVGAAVACPGRKILCLEGDGSGMYTLQSLWTMARENLNIVTLIFANRTYEILKGEFKNVGAGVAGRKALDMLEIGRPDLDWIALAKGHGVPATRAQNLDELAWQLGGAMRETGPQLIEIVL
jgi:acetolactate synthase I/II/III large subunit